MNNAGIIDAMTFNANGNPTRVENDSTTTVREMYWDEDNRLMVLSDNGKTSRYTYNHAGERAVKSHGSMEGVAEISVPKGTIMIKGTVGSQGLFYPGGRTQYFVPSTDGLSIVK